MKISSKYLHHIVKGQEFFKPSLTQQHFAPDADINVIVDRYTRTGQLPVSSVQPVYADTASMPSDYQQALHAVREADGVFLTLPAVVRREFDNDPGKFFRAMHDPAFLPRAIELGLVAQPVSTPEVSPSISDKPPANEPSSA